MAQGSVKRRASAEKVKAFRTAVWRFYRTQGRHELSWRQTRDPYRILVSEVMLQQTQVERAVRFYEKFIAAYPTPAALAAAPLGDVLRAWQGLGYNRRAKMLHAAAQEAVRAHGGRLPETIAGLESLPGIGHYTARAVAAFARNEDCVFIETNIRTALIHHFYPRKKDIRDAELLALLAEALPKGRAREWYAALMDYGAHLKRSGVKLNHRAKAYAKQAAFEGSLRQARGAVLRALTRTEGTRADLLKLLGPARESQMTAALAELEKEGMIVRKGARYRLP